MQKDFWVKFWGVRGTVPVTGPSALRYGGNTSCVEVRCGDRRLILDAGTGLYPLGESDGWREADLFISHTHIDHIQGFPFFSPLYRKDFTLRVWAGHLAPRGTIRKALAQLMSPPLFPLTLDFLKAKVNYIDFQAGEALSLPGAPGILVRTLPLNHPGSATAYRIEYAGHSVCYVTDVEHREGELDPALLAFIKGTDLFIYDCTFGDENFGKYVGWGHSTWQQAVRLADAAGVRTLAVFHHDPGLDDAALDARHDALRKLRPGSVTAREGLRIEIAAASRKKSPFAASDGNH